MRLLLLGFVCAAAQAAAQEAPLTTPTRDVDVTYHSTVAGTVIEQRSRYRATDGKLRLDAPTPGLYMIVDPRAQTMEVVSDRDRGVVDMRLRGPVAPGGFAPGGNFKRLGGERVAGVACTEWETVDRQGQTDVACFTEDGVLLRLRRGTTVLAEATRVSYGAADPSAFAVPPGYTHTAAPEKRP